MLIDSLFFASVLRATIQEHRAFRTAHTWVNKMTLLEKYQESGKTEVPMKGNKMLKLIGVSSCGDVAIADLASAKSTRTAVYCPKVTVTGSDGAEVWNIMDGRGRTLGWFALFEQAGKLSIKPVF